MGRIALLTPAFGLLIGADEPNNEDKGRLQGNWSRAQEGATARAKSAE